MNKFSHKCDRWGSAVFAPALSIGCAAPLANDLDHTSVELISDRPLDVWLEELTELKKETGDIAEDTDRTGRELRVL